MVKRIFLFCFLALLASTPAIAQTITFTWDPHDQAAVIEGFKLYQSKQSGNYTSTPVATFTGGSLTTGTIAKPTQPGRYYWVLTSFMADPAGGVLESTYSNEVTDVVKPKAPTGFARVLGTVASAPYNATKTVGRAVKSIFVNERGLRIQ